MGGEEFLVLIKRSHAEAAETLAETLRVAIGGLRLAGFPIDFRITASIGITAISCVNSTENADRPPDVRIRFFSDRVCSTMAVDDSEHNMPIVTATEG